MLSARIPDSEDVPIGDLKGPRVLFSSSDLRLDSTSRADRVSPESEETVGIFTIPDIDHITPSPTTAMITRAWCQDDAKSPRHYSLFPLWFSANPSVLPSWVYLEQACYCSCWVRSSVHSSQVTLTLANWGLRILDQASARSIPRTFPVSYRREVVSGIMFHIDEFSRLQSGSPSGQFIADPSELTGINVADTHKGPPKRWPPLHEAPRGPRCHALSSCNHVGLPARQLYAHLHQWESRTGHLQSPEPRQSDAT